MDLSYLYNFLDDKDRTILSKKRIIFKGVIFYIKSLIIVSITILGIITILNIFKIDTSTLISSFKEDVEELQEKGILYAIFMIVFFSPFIEEIACRLGLSFKRNHMAFSAFALVYILLSLITKSSYFEEVSYKLLVSLLIGYAVYQIPQTFWNKVINNNNRKILVCCATLLFAFLHINNYTIDIKILPMYFLICLPQLVMGVTIVYFRLNLGFVYGLTFHSLLNAISFLVFI